MVSIEYRATDITEIDLIRPLWVQLNEHNHANAATFRAYYEHLTFDDRKAYFEKTAAAGHLRLDLALETGSQRYVGYCVSSLSPERTGEIESIFVEEEYRSQGIGSVLLARALEWLDANGSVRNRVSVAEGNEGSFPFYRKFGFSPRMTVLEQKKETAR